MSITTEEYADLPERPLISRASVLILGGFLVGTTFAQAIQSGMRTYVFLAGACGIVSYLGLSCAASYRKKRAAQRAINEQVQRMEQRVQQHLCSGTASEVKHCNTPNAV